MPAPKTHGESFRFRELVNHLIEEHGFELLYLGPSSEERRDPLYPRAAALLCEPNDPRVRERLKTMEQAGRRKLQELVARS
jgi:hypothetical protein